MRLITSLSKIYFTVFWCVCRWFGKLVMVIECPFILARMVRVSSLSLSLSLCLKISNLYVCVCVCSFKRRRGAISNINDMGEGLLNGDPTSGATVSSGDHVQRYVLA